MSRAFDRPSSPAQRGSAAVLAVLGVVVLLLCAAGGAYFLLGQQQVPSSAPSVDPAMVANLERDLRQAERRLASLEDYLQGVGTTPFAISERTLDVPDPLPPADAGRRDRGDGSTDPGADNGRGRGGRGGFDPASFDQMRQLRELEDPAAKLELALKMLASDNPMIQAAALRELVELDPQRAVDEVAKLVAGLDPNSRDGFMASRMVAMLGDVQGASATRQLYAFYDSPDASVRRAAAQALEKQGDNTLMLREVNALMPGLTSSDQGERLRALQDVGRLGTASAVSVITPLLSDSSSEVRLRALDALGRSGDASHVSLVEPYLNDPVAAVRDRAARTLQSLREPNRDNADFGFGGRGGFGGGPGGPGGGRGGRGGP